MCAGVRGGEHGMCVGPGMTTEMVLDVAAVTDAGRHRKANADAVLADAASGIFAVADGMGDTPRASAAAKSALDSVRELFLAPWSQLPPVDRSVSEAAERLILGATQANLRLFVEGCPAERRLGATFAGVVICREYLCFGAAGDSRLYLFQPKTSRITRLTQDDTVLSDAVRRGVPYDAAAALPKAHALTRAIGLRRALLFQPAAVRWAPGDVLLACTDGVTDWLDRVAITRALAKCDALDTAARRIVDGALAAGGTDNASAVLVRWAAG